MHALLLVALYFSAKEKTMFKKNIIVRVVVGLFLAMAIMLASGCDSSVGRFKLVDFEDVRVGIKDVTKTGKDGSSVGVTNPWGRNAGRRGDGSGRAARD